MHKQLGTLQEVEIERIRAQEEMQAFQTQLQELKVQLAASKNAVVSEIASKASELPSSSAASVTPANCRQQPLCRPSVCWRLLTPGLLILGRVSLSVVHLGREPPRVSQLLMCGEVTNLSLARRSERPQAVQVGNLQRRQ